MKPALLICALAVFATDTASALTTDQRRAFLRHYAPIILKNADEDRGSHQGHDWITNAFFDGDRRLSNNKENWHDNLEAWTDGRGFRRWRLRPTLYTALIEFREGPHQDVILLYHVYHAKQRGSIHDWERIEIRLNGVRGDPGQGERVAYVVITEHSKHNAPSSYTPDDLNFLQTAHGKHVLIWQAKWSGLLGLRKAELHYVEDSAADLRRGMRSNQSAKVDINGAGDTAFHYVFVPQDDPAAVRRFKAKRLTQRRARKLAARTNDTVRWDDVKRIRYELQDLADLLPTHLDQRDWEKGQKIRIRTPVLNEDGTVTIPASTGAGTTFYYQAKDTEDSEEDRKGYPRKHWFWGTYFFDRTTGDNGGSWTSQWVGRRPIRQHDYFAHNGVESSGDHVQEQATSGRWLRESDGWWRSRNGGFDGRWVQLFAD